MAPSASFTTTRRHRVLHWLFPSRRAMLALAAVEIAASLVGLPPSLHAAAGLMAHLALAVLERRR